MAWCLDGLGTVRMGSSCRGAEELLPAEGGLLKQQVFVRRVVGCSLPEVVSGSHCDAWRILTGSFVPLPLAAVHPPRTRTPALPMIVGRTILHDDKSRCSLIGWAWHFMCIYDDRSGHECGYLDLPLFSRHFRSYFPAWLPYYATTKGWSLVEVNCTPAWFVNGDDPARRLYLHLELDAVCAKAGRTVTPAPTHFMYILANDDPPPVFVVWS
ncbi:hypothetical protein N657DRAFT_706456 [Parathielavia appendiculata]|uniref:Uncharacterized protein n=1 Tax=Parathielavia appendiculata TaxID=2587402 RepID=A0AAN6YZH0_9PEZI|nr:hypothetical protein N657DRAFT_706456 [Parathielavia appendiculata]